MSRDPIKQSTIEAIKAAGFDVYMRDPYDTYLIYTDGTNVAYLQNDRFRGMHISAKYYPHKYHGSGAMVKDGLDDADLTPEVLSSAFTIPSWVGGQAPHSSAPLRRYKNIAEYLNQDGPTGFNSKFRKV